MGSPPKRNLVFLWSYLEWGGAQIYLIAIMKEAIRNWDVKVALPRASSPEILAYLQQAGVSYEFLEHHLDIAPARTLLRKLQRQYHRIVCEIEAYRYLSKYDLRTSIFHIEFSPWQSWILLTLLSLRRAKVFVTLHNALPVVSGWRELLWKVRLAIVGRLRGFNIFCSNEHTKLAFKRYFPSAFWKRIKVTYTCVDPRQIQRALNEPLDLPALKQRLLPGIGNARAEVVGHGTAGPDCRVVLCVAQFIDRKGRWDFLNAAKIVTSKLKDVVFVWVSPTEPSQEDDLRIDSYGLGDKFRLVLSSSLGTSRAEVLSGFRIADVFAHPSLVDGLPIAVLEAMALGLPVIASNINALPEAIIDHVNGILIEPSSPEQLAEAIEELLSSETLRQELGEAGRETVLSRFDERKASQIAIAEYEGCFQ